MKSDDSFSSYLVLLRKILEHKGKNPEEAEIPLGAISNFEGDIHGRVIASEIPRLIERDVVTNVRLIKTIDSEVVYENKLSKESLKGRGENHFYSVIPYDEFKEPQSEEENRYFSWDFYGIPDYKRAEIAFNRVFDLWKDDKIKMQHRNVLTPVKQIELVTGMLNDLRDNFGNRFCLRFENDNEKTLQLPELLLTIFHLEREGIIKIEDFMELEPCNYYEIRIDAQDELSNTNSNLNTKKSVQIVWDEKNKLLRINDILIDISKSKHQFDLLRILFEEQPVDTDLHYNEVYDFLDPTGSLDLKTATKRYSNAANQFNNKVQKLTGLSSVLKTTRNLVRFNPDYHFEFQIIN